MPENIIRIDRHMPGARLDRLVTQKVTGDTQRDTRRFRPTRSPGPSMYERSGLSVTSLTGRLFADSTVIRIPSLKLLTPHSEMNLTAQTYWELINIPTTGRLTARFNARIGKPFVSALKCLFKTIPTPPTSAPA